MGVVFCYFVAETEQNCIAFEELATKKKRKTINYKEEDVCTY